MKERRIFLGVAVRLAAMLLSIRSKSFSEETDAEYASALRNCTTLVRLGLVITAIGTCFIPVLIFYFIAHFVIDGDRNGERYKEKDIV